MSRVPARRPALRRSPLPSAPSARERFLRSDRYRVEREWRRYEGTAQRDLFRELRERFLDRNLTSGAWAVDIGSGPGRFTRRLSSRGARVVALDLSIASLKFLAELWPAGPEAPPRPDRVRGDAAIPPFAPEALNTVLLFGNTLGFAGSAAGSVLRSVEDLVRPAGRLLLEIAPGPGESSQYLTRLPARSVARLLRSPIRAVLPRIDREGFRTMPLRKTHSGAFRRQTVPEVLAPSGTRGWKVLETMAVAPALGPETERLSMIRTDPKAWANLLSIEEEIGRRPDRWRMAASVLLAMERQLSDNTIN